MFARLQQRWNRRFAARPTSTASGVAPEEAERRLRAAARDTANVLIVVVLLLGLTFLAVHAAGLPTHPAIDLAVLAICAWTISRALRRGRGDSG